MKKTLSLTAIVALVIGITLSGCKKEEDIYTPEALPTATISGKVYCDLNETSEDITNQDDYVPSGTKLIFTINSIDLADNPTYQNNTLTYTAIVDANGNYSVSIPATGKSVSVTIYGVDFMTKLIKYDGGLDVNGNPTKVSIDKAFQLFQTSTTVVGEDVVIMDLNYYKK